MAVSREDMLAEARRRGLLPEESVLPTAPRRSAQQQALKTLSAGFIGNVIGIPHAVGEVLAAGAAGAQTAAQAAVSAVEGEPLQLRERFRTAQAEQREQLPASLLRRAPNPGAQDVLATIGAVREIPGAARAEIERYQREGGPAPNPLDVLPAAHARAVEAEEAAAAERPIATAVGELGGDVATLLAGRPGFRSLIRRTRDPSRVATDAKEVADSATRTLMRGLGRTAESGFEGAVIAALNDADPATTAAWSAGVQAGGSMALTAKNVVRRAPLKSFATLWLGHEMFRAVAPGPQDLFESKDEVIRELVAAYGLGLIGAAAGSGRGVGSGELKRITDAISTASRAGIASVVSQLQSAEERGERHYGEIVTKMVEDPDYFGAEARRRLEIASRRERPNALITEIDSLMRSNRFRRKYEAISREGEQ